MKRTRLRSVSNKRSNQLREYYKRREVYLRNNPLCERCRKQATEIHHKAGRLGKYLNDETYWMASCRDCHRFITDNGTQAEAEGWVIRIRK